MVSGKINTTAKRIILILAGGSGTRFWPLSRKNNPKQFLPLGLSGEPLIVETYNRVKSLGEVIIVSIESQLETIKKLLPNVPVIIEPSARNTSACLGLACGVILKEVGDVPVIVLPSDHVIKNDEGFLETMSLASETSEKDYIVTIGIKPRNPETAYGYLKKGAEIGEDFWKVDEFIEKPNLEKARKMLISGECFWNSGMFTFKPGVFLKELAKFLPQHAEVSNNFTLESYNDLESISVDYGVMEKSDKVVMVSGEDFFWSDVGSWDAWCGLLEDSEDVSENPENISIGCTKTHVVSKTKPVVTIGLDNIVIVELEDTLLVLNRDYSQDVKKVVEELERRGKKNLL